MFSSLTLHIKKWACTDFAGFLGTEQSLSSLEDEVCYLKLLSLAENSLCLFSVFSFFSILFQEPLFPSVLKSLSWRDLITELSSGSPCPSVSRYSSYSYRASLGRQTGPTMVPGAWNTAWNKKTSKLVPHAPYYHHQKCLWFLSLPALIHTKLRTPDLDGLSLLFTSDQLSPNSLVLVQM